MALPSSDPTVMSGLMPGDELLQFKDEATLLEEQAARTAPAAAVAEPPRIAPPPPAAAVPEPSRVAPPPLAVVEPPRVAPPPLAVVEPPRVAAPPSAVEEPPRVAPAPKVLEVAFIPAAPAKQSRPASQELTLADLLSTNIDRSWQEAVAIVLELLHDWPADRGFPNPEATVVSASGAVRGSGPAVVDGHSVARAAALTRELLPATGVPAELRGLLDRDGGPRTEHASLAEFVSALGYFGRPNRRADVAALHERALSAYRRDLSDQELDRLRSKVNLGLERRPPFGRAWLGRFRPPYPAAALATGLWVLIGINTAALLWFATAPAPRRVLPPLTAVPFAQPLPAGETVSAPTAASVPVPVGTVGSRTPPSPQRNLERGGSTRTAKVQIPTPPRLVATGSAPAPAAVLVLPVTPARPVEWTVAVREVMPTSVPDRNTSAASRDDVTVFSEHDSDVVPAALLNPQVAFAEPESPTGPAASEFELVVGRAGEVERVRLLSPGNRLRDKMLLAAAKAWQFQPALKDGWPVRYRLKIRVQQ